MNVKITLGWGNSIVLNNVTDKMVDIILNGLVTDSTYIDGKVYEYIKDRPMDVQVIRDIPTMTESEVDALREAVKAKEESSAQSEQDLADEHFIRCFDEANAEASEA